MKEFFAVNRWGAKVSGRRRCSLTRFGLTVLAVLLAVGPGAADQAGATTLKQAIADAVARSPFLDEQRALRNAANHRAGQVFGRLLPSLSLEGTAGPEWFDRPKSFIPENNRKWRVKRQVGVSFSQLLFDAGFTRHELYRERATARAQEFLIYSRTERIALLTAEAFLAVKRLQGRIALVSQRINAHNKLRDKLEKTTVDGLTTQGDVLFVKDQIASAKADLAQLRVSRTDVLAKLHRLTGKRHGTLTRPIALKRPAPSLGRTIRLGLVKHPRLASLVEAKESSREDLIASRRKRFPVVRLESSAKKGFDANGVDGRNDELRAQVTFEWRFFEGGSKRAAQAEKAERFVAADAKLREEADSVREEIEKTWKAQIALARHARAIEQQLERAKEVHAVYEIEFDVGQRSINDLTDALDRTYRLRESLSSARIVHLFSSYQLRAATGTLLNRLNIGYFVPGAPIEGGVIDHLEKYIVTRHK